MDTGSSYNFATEYNIKVLSAAAATYGTPDPTSTGINIVRFRRTSIRYKSEVETVPQTGSTNNLTTETDIDAISVVIPMFWGQVFHWCICQLYKGTRLFLHPEIPRWQTDTGSSYNFATENDIKALSAAAAMF